MLYRSLLLQQFFFSFEMTRNSSCYDIMRIWNHHKCREAGPNHSVGILTFPNSTYYMSRNENKTVTLQKKKEFEI